MGTDIHAVVQRLDRSGKYVDIETRWKCNRHYRLFAWLANVRNDENFYGHLGSAIITPLSCNRGIPDDYVYPFYDWENDIDTYNGEGVWLGYHGFTWLTGKEILEGMSRLKDIVVYGSITLEQYRNWDGKSPLTDYYELISFNNQINITPSEADDPNYPYINGKRYFVKLKWTVTANDLRKEFRYFTDEVMRLMYLHGPIRFILGFDS